MFPAIYAHEFTITIKQGQYILHDMPFGMPTAARDDVTGIRFMA
jgi:hypothetical protein